MSQGLPAQLPLRDRWADRKQGGGVFLMQLEAYDEEPARWSFELQALHDSELFGSDRAVARFMVQQALDGDRLARCALGFLRAQAPGHDRDLVDAVALGESN